MSDLRRDTFLHHHNPFSVENTLRSHLCCEFDVLWIHDSIGVSQQTAQVQSLIHLLRLFIWALIVRVVIALRHLGRRVIVITFDVETNTSSAKVSRHVVRRAGIRNIVRKRFHDFLLYVTYGFLGITIVRIQTNRVLGFTRGVQNRGLHRCEHHRSANSPDELGLINQTTTHPEIIILQSKVTHLLSRDVENLRVLLSHRPRHHDTIDFLRLDKIHAVAETTVLQRSNEFGFNQVGV